MDVALERRLAPEMEVEVCPPQLPEDPGAWVEGVVRGEPVLESTPSRTELGWPMMIVRTASRVIAVYEFFDTLAAVELREPVDRERALALLASARPDWRGEQAVVLSDLWTADEP